MSETGKKLRKSWVQVGNTYTLFVELDGEILTKKFTVPYYNKDVVELNKKLKEYDLIETIKQRYRIKKIDDNEVYYYKT